MNPSRRQRRRPFGDGGQATAELALVLPVVVTVVLVVVQILAVTRDAVALTGATRAAARAAIVDGSPGSVQAAASRETRLMPRRLTMTAVGGLASGQLIEVVGRYRAPTDVPVVGRFVGDIALTERFVVQRE